MLVMISASGIRSFVAGTKYPYVSQGQALIRTPKSSKTPLHRTDRSHGVALAATTGRQRALHNTEFRCRF